ncbi:anion transporter, chloroplastic-like [Raphidocelis subcapitata]|uniref:Anion transporter, chloroplastic-like n=1 Tax=Raphidocelis subcapitata TaxID=307507 RepID=A0A2V0NTG3_9CHLO|nr:anion transporter, chloroplastic-like [Raphidocelis subcapitata]|eukprot:GBF90924.1 anion transporter, chloroplastic-like [Raphidocelis subcapitata]
MQCGGTVTAGRRVASSTVAARRTLRAVAAAGPCRAHRGSAAVLPGRSWQLPQPACAGLGPLPAAAPRRLRVTARGAAAGGAGELSGGGAGAQRQTALGGDFLRVVLPTALALLVCNMDRICLSVAILPMSLEFGWPASLQGVIQSSFLWGYMATQLLGGALADKFGGKRVMAGGIVWFSLASLTLPLALSAPVEAAGLTVPAVLLARCCVGLGEGVALPSMNNLVARHVPPSAKARALGMCFSGFHSGNLIGLLLSPLILVTFGWRALFLVFGVLGAPLLAVWNAIVPDKPRGDGGSSGGGGGGASGGGAAEAGKDGGSGSVTLGRLLSHPATWAIIVVNFVNHWGYFIYLNWMPTYFSRALGFDLRASSLLSFLPWLVMAVGSSAAGVLADSLIARGVDVTAVRKGMQTVSMLVPAAALLLLSQPGLSPAAAVACMTAALGVTSLGQAGFVANMSDIAPRNAGQMFGLCNTFGSAAGILGVVAVGVVVEATGSFAPVFQITAAMYVVAVAVWNVLCTGERVF